MLRVPSVSTRLSRTPSTVAALRPDFVRWSGSIVARAANARSK
jgi:hypothetical protein